MGNKDKNNKIPSHSSIGDILGPLIFTVLIVVIMAVLAHYFS
jgi:hypothetical protein